MFAPTQLEAPSEKTVASLLSWRPEHGVISLCIDADPADRSERWKTEMRNGLRDLVQAAAGADRETHLAVEATAARIEAELTDEPLSARMRGALGFVEADRKQGEERWYSLSVSPHGTEVLYGRAPQLHPLLAILDQASPLGVAAVSAERVRLLDWRMGRAEELHNWELEYFGEDWREQKAQKPRDPASGQAVSAAGRDQFGQRLEATRERFAHETGALAANEAKRRGWRDLLVFGDDRYATEFEGAFDGILRPRHVDGSDLVSEPTEKIERRIESLLPDLSREREHELIARIKDAALSGGRGALGFDETMAALREGRVQHLVYDAESGHPDERMIELALSTSTAITPVEGDSAAGLAEEDGVAALLRY
jgi:hypothetical protein